MKKTLAQKSFWVTIIGGMLTGMGNGSVFGAAMMCLVGRGSFGDWGGAGSLAFNPYTFTGFVDWCMIVFGLAYVVTLSVSMVRHGALEAGH
ncbi:MAG: hypothetical protein K2P57_01235 [Burkholderiales bacterium]|nr:hypothetical protein [Burkholderiales bacterium]